MDLLRAFATVAETGGFTSAARQLNRTQSTVSLQIKRLEESLNTRLFERVGREVTLTPDGEILHGYARQILKLNNEARERLSAPELGGAVRLGTPEDFATSHLPGVLARFSRNHPSVALEVTCDLTLNLLKGFAGNAFDLVLVKQEPGEAADGALVWRETLVWVAAEQAAPEEETPLPLVLSPQPCVYRRRALSALEGVGRAWRIAYTSPSLSGAQAAVMAGLGVTALPRDMVPGHMRVLGPDHDLPPLEDTAMVLRRRPNLTPAGERLAEHIIHSLENTSHAAAGKLRAVT